MIIKYLIITIIIVFLLSTFVMGFPYYKINDGIYRLRPPLSMVVVVDGRCLKVISNIKTMGLLLKDDLIIGMRYEEEYDRTPYYALFLAECRLFDKLTYDNLFKISK